MAKWGLMPCAGMMSGGKVRETGGKSKPMWILLQWHGEALSVIHKIYVGKLLVSPEKCHGRRGRGQADWGIRKWVEMRKWGKRVS